MVAVLGVGSYFAATSLADNAFDDLLDVAEEIESEDTYGERFAYLGTECSLGEGLDDLDDWDRTMVIQRAFSDIDSALSSEVQVGIAELENISVPPWAGSVEAARQALIAHEQAWVDLLDDELKLASRVKSEESLETRNELLRELTNLRELAAPTLEAKWTTAERRFTEAANSDKDERRITDLFAGTAPDCSEYEQALDRWGQ